MFALLAAKREIYDGSSAKRSVEYRAVQVLDAYMRYEQVCTGCQHVSLSSMLVHEVEKLVSFTGCC